MLLNKSKKLIIALLCSLFMCNVFAESADLAVRFLDKANEAYENGSIDNAYKYVNQALSLSKDDTTKANVLYFAQIVYSQKLNELMKDYDEIELIDIKANLDKFPDVENYKISKLIKQIETKNRLDKEAAEKKLEAERFEAHQEAIREQIDLAAKNQAEVKEALEMGFQDMGSAFVETAKEQKKSTKVIAFAVIGIASIILVIILLIVIICKKGFQHQKVQQEQYIQAFKMLANNQNQTNRIMLGGVTDIYGNGAPLKLAGSSTWAPAMALPDVEFSQEDEEEIKQLAVKCEEIGAKIDSYTGRKNNSKNVSEIVYKLSLQLGLSPAMAMVNFCAAMIYDAGFLGIDQDLLTSANLTEEEKEAMKEHVTLADKYLDFVPKKYWEIFSDAANKHHENLDGSGYPKGLKGDEVPQIARLIRVAESYISLSSKRSYRAPMDKETAVAKLKEEPNFYDEVVVDALEKIV